MYHSPWYVGIIGLILLSLTVCTFKRVIPARLPPLRPVKIDKIPLHATFEAPGDAHAVRDGVTPFSQARGWQHSRARFRRRRVDVSRTVTTGRVAACWSRTSVS